MEELALISADTDKVKQYVFESNTLPEIRGASGILTTLNEETIPNLFRLRGLGDSIVYAGGGSLLAIVPRSAADELCREIERRYVAGTGVATITAVRADVDEASLQQQFGEQFRRMQYRLKRAKESRPFSPLFEVAPHARRCAACALRPAAAQVSHIRAVDDRWLCDPCYRKLERGLSGEKASYVKRFEEDGSTEAYWGDYAEASQRRNVMRANDVREVAQAERERRFIGFIYADGNGIGKRLVAARTRQEFEQISHDLREAVPKAVFRALAEHIKVRKVKDEEGQERPVHPWEIIALGGDDALVIVPGDVALQIAEATCRYFTQNLREAGWQDPPTMSAGVVIAHESNPIRFVRELAEQLLKSAKRRTRELRQPDGAIDFIVLKSQSMVAADLDTLRQQAYTAMVGPREQLHLAGRPFSLMELRALLTQARALRTANFPRSQTQAIRASIREAAHMGRPWTALFYHRQWDRMPVEQKALLNEIEKYWRGVRPNSTIDVYPWLELEPKHGQQRAVSVWEDLHEIRDLLPTEAVERHTQTAELGDFTQLVKEETERLKKEAANANANTGD